MKTQFQFRRRNFLKTLAVATPFAASGSGWLLAQKIADSPSPRVAKKTRAHELTADLVIIGGSLGGCAAALAAARNKLRVTLTEETDWIGGQLTSHTVPPDENPWIESFGGTRSYLELRTRIRDYYRRNYPLTAEARAKTNLNPGSGGVSKLCHEPRVALA